MKNDDIIILENEVEVKKDFVDKGKIKYLSEDEFTRLKRTLDDEQALELKMIIMLQYILALRINEVLKIKCSDIKMLSDKQGKNYYVVQTHNSKQRREINRTKELRVSTEVAMLLLSVINKYGLKMEDFVCRTKYGKVMSERNYNKYLKKIFEKANIDISKAHSHAFRHSRAIHLLNAGMNIAQLQRVLGHTNFLNTMIYTRYSNYDVNKVLEAIDG